MNPSLLFFLSLSCPPISVFKSLDRKTKSIAEEGLCMEARTRSQHSDTALGVVFFFQSHGEETIHQKGRTEADAEFATHRGEHGAGRAFLQQEGKRLAPCLQGPEGCSGVVSAVQGRQARCLRSQVLSKPAFYYH